MARPKCSLFPLLFLISIVSPVVSAQAPQTITVRILDSRTGQRITPTGFLVRVDHQSAAHNEWVRQNEDGTTQLTLPTQASVFLLHVTYDSSTETYVNCDTEKRYQTPGPRWYSISEIAAKGLVTLNGCINQAREDKLRTTANPREFVLYVRKQNWKEESQN